MIFETEVFYAALVEKKDLNDIVEIYNSNKYFLLNHMDCDRVTHAWISEEQTSMKKSGFSSCKVVEKSSGKMIGIIDFRADVETYLSLLMLHNDYKNRGYGKLIYQALEKHVRSLNSQRIRIDVVTGYDAAVLTFWHKSGFTKFKDIELNWTGKILSAVVMKKDLC